MKEVKFRALVNHNGAIYWEYYTTLYEPAWLDFCKIIVKDLQFTGLHDRNGKEIYEGDIIEPEPDAELRYEVVWNEYRCGFWLINKYHRKLAILDRPYKEFVLEIYVEPFERRVIGNIYENPELLEK